MKKLLILLLLMLPLVTAVNTYKIDNNLTISHPIRINGAPAEDAICYINVYDPDGIKLVNYQLMNNFTSSHNYSLSGSLNDDVGVYNYDITCSSNGYNQTTGFQYEITYTGKEEPGTMFIVVYSLIFIAIFAFILYFFLHGIAKGGHLKYDIRDLSVSWGFLFAFIAMYVVFINYWNDATIGSILVWLLGIIATTNGFIPIVLFMVSIMFGSIERSSPYDMFGGKRK